MDQATTLLQKLQADLAAVQDVVFKRKPSDYLTGRISMPPWFFNKKQRSFIYANDLAINNGVSGRIDIQLDADSYFLVKGIQIISGLQTASMDLATVQVTDNTYSQPWSNAVVPLRDIAGKGDAPKVLDDGNLLRPSSTLSINISNATGSNTQFYVAVIGQKVYNLTSEEVSFLGRRLWFQYVMSVSAISAGAVGQKTTVGIFNESDFLLKKIYSTQLINTVIGATAGSESAEIMMQIRDTSTDYNLFSKKLAARLIAGADVCELLNVSNILTNGEGFKFPRPVLFKRNSAIEAEFDNRANSTTAAFNVTFEGCRVFSE